MGCSVLSAAAIALAMQATQGSRATVVGVVRDGVTGGPIAGVTVELSDVGRVTTTDSDGRYELRAVAAGPQHITVRFIGHAARTLHALVPAAGRLEINVVLRPVPHPLETVEVRSRVSVRGIEVGDSVTFPDRASSIAAVRNHSAVAEADIFEALGGGEVRLEPESPNGIHVRGGAADQVAFLLDGVPVLNPYHAAGMFSAWNPDAIAGLRLSTPVPGEPYALSGTLAADTREVGATTRVQGGVSSTQARLTVDGPLGPAGAGYLVSVRSRVSSAFGRDQEPSYVRGEAGDQLAKLEIDAFGGRARLLAYSSWNELSSLAATQGDGRTERDAARNGFEWQSRSYGAAWSGAVAGSSVRVLGWSASGSQNAGWGADAAHAGLIAGRRDRGIVASVQRTARGSSTTGGVRVERSSTAYRAAHAPGRGAPWRIRSRTPITTVFAQHEQSLGSATVVELGASLAAVSGGLHVGPGGEVRWMPSSALTLSAGYARLHQFAQSLRNPESVAGNVFPVELYVGAGTAGVPIARSDQAVLAASYRPAPAAHFGLQAYARRMRGLLLVAPRDAEPFSMGDFAVGVGATRGIAAEAAFSSARVGLLASYAIERVRLADGALSYVPQHAAAQRIDGGLTMYPTPTWAIRLGSSAAFGRHATSLDGEFEWEACNLLDQGCEFGGSPRAAPEALGRTTLPSYIRIDLSARKHLHLDVGGRDVVLALFGTVSNILNRPNVLTYSEQAAGVAAVPIRMWSRTPLVVGLDWWF